MSALTLVLALLQSPASTVPTPVATRNPYPFAVGERLEYSAKLGILKLGTGSLEVAGLDTVQGVESFRLRFRLQGGVLTFKIDDVLESWVGVPDFISRRFVQDYTEKDRRRQRHFDIFPDSGYYREAGRDTTLPTPTAPLDDAAFFYFIRITPLEVGKTYIYHRYFRQEKNPVTLKVLKRETMELPGGTKIPCLVLHPIIETRGLFSPRSETRIWVTDDARRLPVQIRAKFPFGTITLRLESMIVPTAPVPAVGP